jgi:Patched family
MKSDTTIMGSTTTNPTTEGQEGPADTDKSPTLSHKWSAWVKHYGHRPILAVLRPTARISAQNPKRTIASVIVLSLACLGLGLMTNFNVDVDTDALWTPKGSNPIKHLQYVADTFSATPSYIAMFFHAKGANVLSVQNIQRAFTALEAVTNHPMYHEICSEKGTVMNREGTELTCDIYGVTRFWWNNSTEFEIERKKNEGDPEEHFIHKTVAKRAFLDQFPVLHEEIFGFLEYNATYATSAQSFFIVISLPEDKRTNDVEMEMVHNILALNEQWVGEDDFFRVEAIAEASIAEELIRAINQDIPLVPLIFFVMAAFTALVFARRHKVYSRASLGAAAVMSVMFSILSGFGLLFIVGVPFCKYLF